MASAGKLDLINGLTLLGALTLATVGGGLGGLASGPARVGKDARTDALPHVERAADGSPFLRDARGMRVPLRDYRRIASGTLVADRVLADLCEPTRVVAYSRYAEKTPLAHRYAGKPTLGARDDVERVLALAPDLLIVSDLVDASYLARLEEHGIAVFVLGPMKGLSTLLPDLRALGLLIGASERANRYAAALARRLEGVARDVRTSVAPRALYLSIYGDKLFAAARHTSYHDVITYAGLADAAASGGLVGWPELSSEQVLTLDPDVLITRTGMSALLCRHPGLALLRPCLGRGRVVELDGALLDDPGPAMLEAAEALHDAYWLR